jgi:transcriptional regulator with XRE-family HTH domain
MSVTWIRNAKEMMRQKRLTQADIASSMGKKSRGAIGHYFTERSQPTIEQLESLAKFLGVSLSWLVSNSDDDQVDNECLELCLQLVEEAQEALGDKVDLSPAQISKITAYLYQMSKDGQTLSQKKTENLINLLV